MHQLLSSFLRQRGADDQNERLPQVRQAQRDRFVSLATQVAASPADADLAAALSVYPLQPALWATADVKFTRAGEEVLGRALWSVGRFADALPWCEAALREADDADVPVNPETRGSRLHQVGYCLSQTGRYDEARPWYEHAVEQARQGDVHGRVDHQSLGRSLQWLGYLRSRVGDHHEARAWYEQAAEASRRGDVFGTVDKADLAETLKLLAQCLRALAQDEEADICERERVTLPSGGGESSQGV